MNTRPLFWTELPTTRPVIKREDWGVRVGGCLLYLPERHKFLLFGGEENTIAYEKDKQKEAQVEQEMIQKMAPQKAINEAIQNVPKARSSVAEIRPHTNNLIYIYDLMSEKKENTWRAVETKGRVPNFRNFFGYCYNAPYLLIQGGESIQDEGRPRAHHDLYILNVESMIWRRFFALDAPAPRIMHIMENINNEYYIYGGFSITDNRVLKDLWVLNCDNINWNAQILELPGAIWSQKSTTGRDPGALRGHKSVGYEKYLAIFGGLTDLNECMGELYFLDTDTLEWSIPQTTGKAPSPRAFHEMKLINENNAVLFGGMDGVLYDYADYLKDLYILDLKQLQWIQPITGGTPPTSRFCHQMACSYHDENLRILIMGGLDPRYKLRNYDMYLLAETDAGGLSGKNWHYVEESIAEKDARYITRLAELEKKLIKQASAIGDLEENINTVRTKRYKVEEELNILKSDVSHKEKIIENSTSKWIVNLNAAEIKRNKSRNILEDLTEVMDSEKKYKSILQNKARLLEEVFQNIETFILGLDKANSLLMEHGVDDSGLVTEIIDLEKDRSKHRTDLGTLFKLCSNLTAEQNNLLDHAEEQEARLRGDQLLIEDEYQLERDPELNDSLEQETP